MNYLRSLSAGILTAAILLGVVSLVIADRNDDYYREVRENLELFNNLFREVTVRYVDNIDPEQFVNAGIRGMLETLDPYTVFIEKEDTDDLQILTTGEYGGVGIVIGLRGGDKILTVISPMEGTPAERLGIRAGDQIIEIDGVSTIGFDTRKAASMMRGEAGTNVNIKISRPGIEDPIEYTITREVIVVKDVSYNGFVREGIGYIRLTRFSRKAGDEMRDALKRLFSQELHGLILDLRGNPGGLLESAVDIAELFVPKGEVIVSTRGMIPEASRVIKSNKAPMVKDIPVVVLVDGGSASASEIVAGAIQDLDLGVVIGGATFGKGLVQSLVSFPNGSELKLTTAKYYTPSGRLIQKIDYFSQDNPVIINTDLNIIDSLNSEKFHTAGGREVLSGGGILPDIEIEPEKNSSLVTGLFRKSMFFEFGNDYIMRKSAQEGMTDPKVMDDFKVFLDSVNFDYQSEGMKELSNLRKLSEKRELSPEFTQTLDKLESLLQPVYQAEFEENRYQIERFLKMEFAYRINGIAGRAEASFAGDPQIQAAVETIVNYELYASILRGEAHAAGE